jgi:hypothetical protein
MYMELSRPTSAPSWRKASRKFDENHVRTLIFESADFFFNLVGDVRDHLHGTAEVVAPAFFLQNVPVDASGGNVAFLGGRLAGIAFVVAEIEIGFGAVVGDVNLTVLVGAHGPRINIEIGIQFHHADGKSAVDEKSSDRGRRDAFAERRYNAAGYDKIFGHFKSHSPCELIAPAMGRHCKAVAEGCPRNSSQGLEKSFQTLESGIFRRFSDPKTAPALAEAVAGSGRCETPVGSIR